MFSTLSSRSIICRPSTATFPLAIRPDALLAGAGDAYFCFVTNQPVIFEDMNLKPGKDFLVARMDQFGYRVPSQLLVVERKRLSTERATFVAFLHGFCKATSIIRRIQLTRHLWSCRNTAAISGFRFTSRRA